MNWALNGNIRRLRRKSFIGQLVLLALGVELLIFASFTTFQLPTPTQRNLARAINATAQHAIAQLPAQWQESALECFPVLRNPVPPVRTGPYTPLCPTALFLGYVLGVPLGLLSTIGFLLLGLFGQRLGVLVFAQGGGFAYLKQPSFGYLLGLIAGAWFAGKMTQRANTSLRQVLAISGGLLSVHLLGLLYLVGGAVVLLLFDGEAAYLNWQPWLFESVRNFSWYSLPYDAVFSLLAVGLGFPFRWLNSVLTAPDIAVRPKPKFDRQLEHVS